MSLRVFQILLCEVFRSLSGSFVWGLLESEEVFQIFWSLPEFFRAFQRISVPSNEKDLPDHSELKKSNGSHSSGMKGDKVIKRQTS